MNVGNFGPMMGRMYYWKTVVFALAFASLARTGLGEDAQVGFPGLTGDVPGGEAATGTDSPGALLQQLQGLLSDPAAAELLQQVAGQLLTGGDDQSAAGGLLQQFQDALGDQAQAEILQEIVDQLLTGQEPAQSLEDSLQQIQALLENPITRAIIEQYLNQLLGGVATIPDGLLEQIADQLSATGSPITGLFQQLQQALLSNSSGSGGLAGALLNSTEGLQDVLQILQDLGLLNQDLEVDWQRVATQVGGEILRYVELNLLTNVSTPCVDHTLQFMNDSANGSPYAAQMVLSNGDFLDLLQATTTYNLASYGNVEQCQSVTAWNPDAPFETQHCNLRYGISSPLGSAAFVVGMCVPASCSPKDLKEMFEMVPAIGDNVQFECIYDYPWNAGSIATLCILWVFLLLITFGTVYHVLAHHRVQASIAKARAIVEERDADQTGKKVTLSAKEREIELSNGMNGHVVDKHTVDDAYEANDNTVDVDLEDGPRGSTEKIAHVNCTCAVRAGKRKVKKLGFLDTFMMSLSPIRNGSKILNTQQPAGSLGVLNGIRVISMWWIILGHTTQFVSTFVDDPRYVETEVLSSFWFSAILYSTVSVDTFFFLSGLLLTYLTLKHLKKANGRINWALFYLHRFIRITPAYMISIAIWATLVFHFGEGPGKIPFFEPAASSCRQYWWTNLLYISNLYPFPGDLNWQCMAWSWYLSNDMQFFIISPFIIYLLYKHSKLGLALITGLCLGSFAITAYLAYHYGVALGFRGAYNNNTVVDYGTPSPDIIYSKPYCRIPAYLVGMVTGFVLFKWIGRPFKMNMWVNTLLWVVATGTGIAVVYGPYREGNENLPQVLSVVYTVLSRPAFVVAVGWVVFSCTMGYGGPVNTLLSWGFWAPLSRITFGAYLLHPIVILIINTSAKAQFHFTYMQFASWFVSNTVFSYAAAFVLSIGVEGPIIGLEKALLGGGARGKKK